MTEAIEGRDSSGRFVPGFSGNPGGRPKSINLRDLVRERMEGESKSPEDAMFAVFASMLKRAMNGDVQAAKLLWDKLCDKEPDSLHVVHDGAISTSAGPTPPQSAAEIRTWAAKLAAMAGDAPTSSD